MAICTLIGAIWAYKSLHRSQNFIISENFRTAFATLFSHTKNLHVICSGFLGACVLFSLVGCFTFINLHLSESPYLLTPADLANIFAIYLIGMVITPLSTRVVIRFGMTSTILLAILVSITGLLMTLFMPLGIVIMGLTLMSSGVFITQSATISYLTSHVSEGSVFGVRAVLYGLLWRWLHWCLGVCLSLCPRQMALDSWANLGGSADCFGRCDLIHA